MLPDIQPGNTKILYFFNCLLDGMHTNAVRNLRNYCAHHSMVVGMTSSVVIPNNRDSADVLPDNTNLYSRLYPLKKILPQEDANMLATELERLISRAKIDVYKMNILPADWKDLYDRILFL